MRDKIVWAVALCLIALVPAACSPGATDSGAKRSTSSHEEVELAVLMGEMQRHSAKLGYALAARNPKLSEFYLHEVEEVTAELLEVEEYEGIQIAAIGRVIQPPLIDSLDESLDSADWETADAAYSALIVGCNRCHAATEHEFIVVLEPEGSPPWNQDFQPSD